MNILFTMNEKAYLLRRKLHIIAFGLAAISLLVCYCHRLSAHVDLVHVEVDTIVREIMQEIHNDLERDRLELLGIGQDYGNYATHEEGNEPGVKHD